MPLRFHSLPLSQLLFDLHFFCHFRYWNDKEVLEKLGEVMGLAVSGGATSSELLGPDEAEPGNEEVESIIHHTASIGDVEVMTGPLKKIESQVEDKFVLIIF